MIRQHLCTLNVTAYFQLDKSILLHHLFTFVQNDSFQQQAGILVCPHFMSIAQSIFRLEYDGLSVKTGDARLLGGMNQVILVKRGQLLRQQSRETLAAILPFHLHGLVITQIPPHFIVIANELTTWAVQTFNLLVLTTLVGNVGNAHGLHMAVMLIYKSPAVIGLVRSKSNNFWPIQVSSTASIGER